MGTYEKTINERFVLPQKEKGKSKNSQQEACLVVIHGEDDYEKFSLTAKTSFVLGRNREKSDFCINDKRISQRHAKIEYKEGNYYLEDLGSTNGTRLNEKVVSDTKVLKNQDKIYLGYTVLKFLTNDDIESKFYDKIKSKIYKDKLTGAYNRQFFETTFKKLFEGFSRNGSLFSIILFDIDFFKKINDNWGHPTGDLVLKELGELVRKRLRKSDYFCRIGGEEFIIILPDGNEEQAIKLAEVFRSQIESYDFKWKEEKLPVTISLGVCQVNKECTNSLELYQIVDERLYKAKKAGRNQVVSQ